MSNDQSQQPPAPGPANQQEEQRGKGRAILPFVVEFGDDYLRNHTINTPPFQGAVRGEFALARLANRPEGMRDVGSEASRIPNLPGMRLALDPRRKTAMLFDPLVETPEGVKALEQYNALAKANSHMFEQFKGNPRVEHTLTDHQVKTLLMELKQKLAHGNVRVVEGEFPSDSEIEVHKGRELNDPWNQGRKPVFKDQLEEWEVSAQARI